MADLVSLIGLPLTVASLGLAIYTLRQARTVQEETERLRNRYLFRVRAAEFAESMWSFARRINRQIVEEETTVPEQHALLKRCEAQLENFELRLDGACSNAHRLYARK